jgi:uncharacterized membrane protein
MCNWASGGLWFLWPLWFFGFWIVVGLIFRFGFIGRRRWHHAGPWSPAHSAEGILAERFARDEITEKEYRDRVDVLRGSRTK